MCSWSSGSSISSSNAKAAPAAVLVEVVVLAVVVIDVEVRMCLNGSGTPYSVEVHDAKPEEEGEKKLRGRRERRRRRGKGCPLPKSKNPHLAGRKQQYTSSYYSFYKCKQHQNARLQQSIHVHTMYLRSLIIVFDGDLIVFHINWLTQLTRVHSRLNKKANIFVSRSHERPRDLWAEAYLSVTLSPGRFGLALGAAAPLGTSWVTSCGRLMYQIMNILDHPGTYGVKISDSQSPMFDQHTKLQWDSCLRTRGQRVAMDF